jgi:hypothetical protein
MPGRPPRKAEDGPWNEESPMNSSNEKTASLAGHDETVIGQIRASGRARSRWAVHLALLITIIVEVIPFPFRREDQRVAGPPQESLRPVFWHVTGTPFWQRGTAWYARLDLRHDTCT